MSRRAEGRMESGICTVCGHEYRRRFLERHHPAGRVNLPSITVLVCWGCHDLLGGRQRELGIVLDHDRQPSGLQIVCAILLGVCDLAAATAARHLPEIATTDDLRRVSIALARLAAVDAPAGYGPDPSANYRRQARRDRQRKLLARPAAPVRELGFNRVQLAQLLQLGADLAATRDDDDGAAAKLAALAAQADAIYDGLLLASRTPPTDLPQRIAAVVLVLRRIAARLLAVEWPQRPTEADLVSLQMAAAEMTRLVGEAFAFFDELIALGAAA